MSNSNPVRPISEPLITRFVSNTSCPDPGIFVRVGPGQSDKKKALTFFFCFLVLSLFYRSQIVKFKEIYQFSRFQRGSNIFQGGGGGPIVYSL